MTIDLRFGSISGAAAGLPEFTARGGRCKEHLENQSIWESEEIKNDEREMKNEDLAADEQGANDALPAAPGRVNAQFPTTR